MPSSTKVMATLFATLQSHPAVAGMIIFSSTYLLYLLIKYIAVAHRDSVIRRENGCKLPKMYPHRDPILGTDLMRENAANGENGVFMEMVNKRYEKLGVWTYSSLFLGSRLYHTVEPENIKTVLATNFKDYELSPRRKAAMTGIFGHGIFTTDKEEWAVSRGLLRPNFSRSMVGDLDTFEHHISNMMEKIPKDGSTVDLQVLFFELTLDSATEFLFGESTGVLSSKTSNAGQRFADAFTYVTQKAGDRMRVSIFSGLFPDKTGEQNVKYVHEFVRGYVEKALLHKKQYKEEPIAEDGGKYVFLDELAKTGYGAKKIQDELLNVLLAGRDTTAGLLSILFYVLARQPSVWSKLRAEVLQLDGRPSFEQIKNMKYLQYCLNETLRLYPIVPANFRTALVDTILPVGGGPDQKFPILIKAGEQVNYHVYVMHRRKDIYGEDADEFKPERWEYLRPSWDYLPFNGGPRICLGQQFALIEASYTTIRLLQMFKAIEPRSSGPFREQFTLTLASRDGTKVALTPA